MKDNNLCPTMRLSVTRVINYKLKIQIHLPLADFYSKALQGKLFQKYREVLMGWKHIDSLARDDVSECSSQGAR